MRYSTGGFIHSVGWRNAVNALILLLFSISTYASTQNEIQHLLSFVAESDCRYERNGDMYTGAEAATHIQRKYEYYKDKIRTSEDFIQLSATQSLVSRKKYKIHCPNHETITSQDWLLNELQKFRSVNSN